jgi:uncharacterized protein YndB with AHSA1/START domain
MNRPPRPPSESVLGAGLWPRILRVGLVVAAVTLGVGLWGHATGRPWQSMAFFALSATQLAVALGSRARPGSRANPLLPIAVGTALGLQLAGLYLPFFQEVLHTKPLTGFDLLVVFALSTLGYAAIRLDRLLFRRKPAVDIRGEILIDQPVEAVFDYVADQTNEPDYNPRMVRAEKITAGPVAAGTRFRSAMAATGRTAEMEIELTRCDRPRVLASATTMARADIDYTLTFEPVATGTRMRWGGHVHAKGALRLLGPMIIWAGNRQERRIWASLKQRLEQL